ncbi:hypothetical protein PPBDW_II1467 [Photobacterium kishitanii]|nr:hypothetical protein PPBDW_II1467 [Photobacterium kishitanii]
MFILYIVINFVIEKSNLIFSSNYVIYSLYVELSANLMLIYCFDELKISSIKGALQV